MQDIVGIRQLDENIRRLPIEFWRPADFIDVVALSHANKTRYNCLHLVHDAALSENWKIRIDQYAEAALGEKALLWQP